MCPIVSGSCVLSYLVHVSYRIWFMCPIVSGLCVLSYLVHVSYRIWFMCPIVSGSCVLSYLVYVSYRIWFTCPIVSGEVVQCYASGALYPGARDFLPPRLAVRKLVEWGTNLVNSNKNDVFRRSLPYRLKFTCYCTTYYIYTM